MGSDLYQFLFIAYLFTLRTSLFQNPVVYLFHVWYEDRCWSKILCSTIPNPVHDVQVKVTDLEFLYWSLCLSFYNVCFCEAFDGLIHVRHGDRNWPKILYGTIPNPEGYRLRIFIQKFCDKCFTISIFFAKHSMDFIQLWRDNRALSKILCSTIPIPVLDLKIKVTEFDFFVLNLYSVSCCKAFDWFESCLVWMDIRF